MCVTSMVMDHYREKWEPFVLPIQQPFNPQVVPQQTITPDEIAEFRRLMERAREYDKRNHEPECEMEEKRAAILKIAKQLGVEISFL